MDIKVENAENIKLQDPEDTFAIIQKVFYEKKNEVDLMKEHFWAISLNKALKILNLELVSIGCKDRTLADPGDVFRVPLYKSSSYVILVHNHPSGSLKPSDADIDLTNKLMKAGEILDVKVIDHVIVTEKSYFSFEAAGLIDQLQLDNKYALTFVYKKKMERKMEELKQSVEKQKKEIRLAGKQEGIEEGLKKGKKEEKKEIARQMLIDGESIEKIIKYTGLSRQWIGRIKNEVEKANLSQ